MRLKPALRYQLEYMAKASLNTVCVIAIIVVAFRLLGAIFMIGGQIDNINMAVVAFVSLFIVGIASIREDLRMLLQHGMGRYTTYFSTLLIGIISGIVLGLFCELLNLIADRWHGFPMTGLIPHDGQSFFVGWLLHASLLFLAWQLGVFISLLYYRMSKMQQIVFSISAIALSVFVLTHAINSVADLEFAAPIVLPAPLSLTAFVMSSTALVAVLNFLLLRRAQVRE